MADCALRDEFAAQRQAIGDVAIVGDSQAASGKFGKEWLDVTQDGFARGGIADMAEGRAPLQAVDDFFAGEMIADEAHAPFGVKAFAVKSDDARGFLAAMLKGMEAKCREGRRIGMTKDAKDAAFFA